MRGAVSRTRPTSKRATTGVSKRPTSAAGAIKGAKREAMPAFVEPCLATLVAKPPVGPDWVHEIKFDGYRIQVHIGKTGAKLLTRNGLDWTDRFGVMAKEFAAFHDGAAIIDGELVVEDAEGHSNFSLLAEALKSGRSEKFVTHCFDLLYLDGYSLAGAALLDRKAVLEKLFGRKAKSGPIRYSPHLAADGARMLEDACALGLEGIISKRIDRPYRAGRHDDWLKSKCIQVDEFVVIGYLKSSASENAVGALVVGYYERKQLIYAGRVGTGYTQRIAADLMRRLRPMRLDASPVKAALTNLQRKDVIWVRPELVAQIEYRAWTADGLLRHAAFKGLREDKPAKDVRRPVTKTIES